MKINLRYKETTVYDPITKIENEGFDEVTYENIKQEVMRLGDGNSVSDIKWTHTENDLCDRIVYKSITKIADELYDRLYANTVVSHEEELARESFERACVRRWEKLWEYFGLEGKRRMLFRSRGKRGFYSSEIDSIKSFFEENRTESPFDGRKDSDKKTVVDKEKLARAAQLLYRILNRRGGLTSEEKERIANVIGSLRFKALIIKYQTLQRLDMMLEDNLVGNEFSSLSEFDRVYWFNEMMKDVNMRIDEWKNVLDKMEDIKYNNPIMDEKTYKPQYLFDRALKELNEE